MARISIPFLEALQSQQLLKQISMEAAEKGSEISRISWKNEPL
jgi:hypothetical protein